MPDDVDPQRIIADIMRAPGVVDCHDLHVWSLTVGQTYATVHVDVSAEADPTFVLNRIHDLFAAQGVVHATVQIEAPTASREHHKRGVKCHVYEVRRAQ